MLFYDLNLKFVKWLKRRSGKLVWWNDDLKRWFNVSRANARRVLREYIREQIGDTGQILWWDYGDNYFKIFAKIGEREVLYTFKTKKEGLKCLRII